MDRMAAWLQHAGVVLSRMLDPAMFGLDWLNGRLYRELDGAGVPYGWQSWVVTGLWVFGLVMVVRLMSGWARLLVLVLALLVLGRVYDVYAG